MDHLTYIAFFEQAARKHQEIAHGQLLPNDQERKSFFRMSGEDEMQRKLMDGAAFPALCMQIYQGKLSASDKMLVRDSLFGGFEIREHVSDPMNELAIELARARCKRIADEVIALMLDESSKPCSVFKALDVNSIRYQFTGPINTMEYGCVYNFNWKSNAQNINNADLEAIFSL